MSLEISLADQLFANRRPARPATTLTSGRDLACCSWSKRPLHDSGGCTTTPGGFARST
jgi:hypothetical protein